MRFFATYLIYLGVLARAAGWAVDSAPLPAVVWVLLAGYGLLLVSEPWLERRWLWYPPVYTLVQTVLAIGMILTAPTLDFLTLLFLPLSFQAVQFFGLRAGLIWVGVFGLAMVGMLLRGLEIGPGMFMLLSNTGLNALMASFAYLIERTDHTSRENRRIFGELQTAYQALKNYTAQSEALAAAEERQRWVRELHDSLTQTLFSMNLAVQAARLAYAQPPGQVPDHLHRLQVLSSSAAAEVKALIRESPAQARMEGGLPEALARLVSERQAQDNLQIRLEVSGSRQLPENVATSLYRIAQEALNNVVKHAQSRQVSVRAQLEEGRGWLEVEDDGCGFRPETASRPGSLGLEEMAQRAREIGWELEIWSSPGQGTRVRVQEGSH